MSFWNVLTKEFYKPEVNIAGSRWIPVDTLTEKLASLGYTNVFAYEGGLKDWSEGGFPLVKL